MPHSCDDARIDSERGEDEIEVICSRRGRRRRRCSTKQNSCKSTGLTTWRVSSQKSIPGASNPDSSPAFAGKPASSSV